MSAVLGQFPVSELAIYLPEWVDALGEDDELKKSIYSSVHESCCEMRCISDVDLVCRSLCGSDHILTATAKEIDMGTGCAAVSVEMPRELYYDTISKATGLSIKNDGELMALLTEMAAARGEYQRVSQALDEVRETGYGIVMPGREEMLLEEPEIVNHNGHYSVRLKASAPSIHMIRADIVTEVSPAIGGEKASQEILSFLLQGYEGDVNKIWDSNIFGKSLYDIAGEGLAAKVKSMPNDARAKLQETLQRIINEGSGGLICIIL